MTFQRIPFMTAIALLSIAVSTTTAQSKIESGSEESKIYRNFTKSDLEEEADDLQFFLNDILVVDISRAEESVDSFVQHIQEQSPIHLNIIVLDDAKDIKIPSIKLTNVSAGAVFNAVSVATDGLVNLDYDESGQIAYVRRERGFIPNNRVSVINLSNVLKAHSNESFLSAVEIGMEMMGSKNSSIQMKLHEETGTLFLRGSNEEIFLIEELVQQLSRNNRGAPGGMSGAGGGGRSDRTTGSAGFSGGGSGGGGIGRGGAGPSGLGGPGSGGGSSRGGGSGGGAGAPRRPGGAGGPGGSDGTKSPGE